MVYELIGSEDEGLEVLIKQAERLQVKQALARNKNIEAMLESCVKGDQKLKNKILTILAQLTCIDFTNESVKSEQSPVKSPSKSPIEGIAILKHSLLKKALD